MVRSSAFIVRSRDCTNPEAEAKRHLAQVAAEASLGDKGQVARGVKLVRDGQRQILPALAELDRPRPEH